MSFYDVCMLIVLGGAIWFGFWKGLAWQIASVAAIIVSYVVAMKFRDPVSQFIQAEAPWNNIGAMLILFLGTSIVIWMIYGRVKGSIKKMELRGFDRQAGALLGAVKGCLLCMVITMFAVSLLGERAHDAIHHSKLGPYVINGIDKVHAVVPQEFARFITPHVEELENQLGHGLDRPVGDYPGAAQIPGTTGYSSDGVNQNPNQLPQAGYPSNWQWQAPSTPAPNNSNKSNPWFGQKQTGTAWPGSNSAAPAGTQAGTVYDPNRPVLNPNESPLDAASREIFETARQKLGEVAGQAAQRAIQGGQNR
ncbi:MAG: CvpA family protein [Mariniblastus sp.]|nr:CvpA family protein [Mariniblastus sp.]